jgi:hypothetical protein
LAPGVSKETLTKFYQNVVAKTKYFWKTTKREKYSCTIIKRLPIGNWNFKNAITTGMTMILLN